MGATGFAFLFVVGLALADRQVRSVKHIHLMEASVGYPVLGVLPLHTASAFDPKTLDIDSLYMRSVAAIVGASGLDQNTMSTIAVYPLCPRDGGTSFSISLALCCSRMGMKTLLIELASGGEIIRNFGVKQDSCVPAVAEDQPHPSMSIWSTEIPDLYILQFNAMSRSLQGDGLQAVGRAMHSVKSIYDVVIVDAPDIAKEPYALRLAGWLDRVLVVSQANISRIELLRYKLRPMRLWPDVHTGIVLNGVAHDWLML